MGDAPLAGITVLDLTQFEAGPSCTEALAWHGADVVKIELPGYGDHSRNIHVGPGDPRSAVYSACNRGKRSVSLNLGHAEGAEIFKRLVRDADVVVSNFTPGTM
jgi:formyl-CoA transferase